jgi:ABC-type nitrate/sulfonate/bicarbonate transport system substrate-binding protein
MYDIKKFVVPALAIFASAVFAVAAGARDAIALEKLKVAKSVATAITFAPLEIGVKAGIWEKNGLELDIQIFRGASQAMQALTANSVEIALSSGPSLAFIKKGVPAKGVAAFANAPLNMVLVGASNANVKAVEDLRGKRIGVTSAGSLTSWLLSETNARKGWSSNAMTAVPLGGSRTQLAALERKEIQGRVAALEQGIEHEMDGSGTILVRFGEVINDFITHIIFARDETIAQRPKVVKQFLQGWWDTVGYMDKNRAQSIKWAAEIVGQPEVVVEKAFDTNISMLTRADGSFDPAALKTLSRSFVELKVLDEEPDMSTLYTTQFLPVKSAM